MTTVELIQHKGRGITFLSLLLIFGLMFCSGNSNFLNFKNSSIKITDTLAKIEIVTELYQLQIDKSKLRATLNNISKTNYTTFPLSFQFPNAVQNQDSTIRHAWQVQGEKIIFSATMQDSVLHEIILKCFSTAFEIQFRVRSPQHVSSGISLFRDATDGFNTKSWKQYFSPEPDNYFADNPTIDVKADRDRQWKFSPAPLNLSFETPAGWFSIGLVELPNATIFAFKNNSIWLDYPWKQLSRSDNQLLTLPALVFTFNDSPWDAVGDYSKFVYHNMPNRQKNLQTKKRPAWWKQPLVSTRGEQLIRGIAAEDSTFNGEWIETYITKQREIFGDLPVTFILEDKWCQCYGDPTPSARFKNLRSLIDRLHEQKIKVVLSWKAWKVERNSLPVRRLLMDGSFCDASHPFFDAYVDTSCKILFGNGDGDLNADGIQFDGLFDVRDPITSKYRDSSQGMGIKEVYYYLSKFYHFAKLHKADALIITDAIDPHFRDVQDMVRINDDWDNKLRREKRARIITQSLPGMLINSDATVMYNAIAAYHLTTGSIYGIPAIHYLEKFADGPISENNRKVINVLLNFARQKPTGKIKFVDYGNWQIVDKNGVEMAKTLPGGNGILIFQNRKKAKLLCTSENCSHLLLDKYEIKRVLDEDNKIIDFKLVGPGIYDFPNLAIGEEYELELTKFNSNGH